jgi:hypothetical protein
VTSLQYIAAELAAGENHHGDHACYNFCIIMMPNFLRVCAELVMGISTLAAVI